MVSGALLWFLFIGLLQEVIPVDIPIDSLFGGQFPVANKAHRLVRSFLFWSIFMSRWPVYGRYSTVKVAGAHLQLVYYQRFSSSSAFW